MTPREVWVVFGPRGLPIDAYTSEKLAEQCVDMYRNACLHGYRSVRYVPAEEASQERSGPDGKCAYCGHPVNSSTCQQNHG